MFSKVNRILLTFPQFFQKNIETVNQEEGRDNLNLIFTEIQLMALENVKKGKEAHGEIETEHPGYLDAQNMFYIRNI
jgi:hypothetical protein